MSVTSGSPAPDVAFQPVRLNVPQPGLGRFLLSRFKDKGEAVLGVFSLRTKPPENVTLRRVPRERRRR